MNRENKRQIIVENSLDVSADRLPAEGVTLQEYRRLGGVPVGQQAETVHSVVLGSIEERPGVYETKTVFANNPSTTSRSGHAVVRNAEIADL